MKDLRKKCVYSHKYCSPNTDNTKSIYEINKKNTLPVPEFARHLLLTRFNCL